MRVEQIISFDQEDANEYRLEVQDEDGDKINLWMHTEDAIRLHRLVVKVMGSYVAEMEAAKASYDRGEGPNGEPKGTWEDSPDDAEFGMDWRHMADLMWKARKEGMA